MVQGRAGSFGRDLARRGIVVISMISLVAIGVVVGAGTAGASDNPIVGTSQCTYAGDGPGNLVQTCTFTGTVNGVPYTGTFDNAVLSHSNVRSCTSSDPRV